MASIFRYISLMETCSFSASKHWPRWAEYSSAVPKSWGLAILRFTTDRLYISFSSNIQLNCGGSNSQYVRTLHPYPWIILTVRRISGKQTDRCPPGEEQPGKCSSLAFGLWNSANRSSKYPPIPYHYCIQGICRAIIFPDRDLITKNQNRLLESYT